MATPLKGLTFVFLTGCPGDPGATDVPSHGFRSLLCSPCGAHLLGVRDPVRLELDRHVVIVDAATGEQRRGWSFASLFQGVPITNTGFPLAIRHGAVHPTGWFALGGGRGFIAHVDPSTASVRSYLLPKTTVSAVGFGRGGGELLVNDQGEAVRRVPLLADERGA